MKRLALVILLLGAFAAQAHLGNPDIFYDGKVGPYPARITIRMPNVVPGRAEIIVRVDDTDPVQTSFLPLYSSTAVTNAPVADVGKLVRGETNLFTGDLWLMSVGAYSVEVRIQGQKGNGKVQIPVTSVALRQLALPSVLAKILLILGGILVLGGIGVAAAAGREAALLPGATAGKRDRWRGFFAAGSATIVFGLALAGGKFWWNVEEGAFRRHLREGAWPDLTADVRLEGESRILSLEVGKESYRSSYRPSLLPDHGKLMHLFLVREGNRDAFAHLHPIRKEGNQFEVALPPLPEGRYAIFSDLTFEGGISSTATNSVLLPATPDAAKSDQSTLERDLDDSWSAQLAPAELTSTPDAQVFRCPSGERVVWNLGKPLRARQDAGLRFSVTDARGEPAALEPYMGMLCHAAVLRSDNTVFSHLHPAGNFSMAAQSFFQDKLEKEAGPAASPNPAGPDHSMHHGHSVMAVSSVYLPYEFPAPGNYRVWVQFKVEGRVVTAVFDAQVGSRL
jgi:hypothetical protein